MRRDPIRRVVLLAFAAAAALLALAGPAAAHRHGHRHGHGHGQVTVVRPGQSIQAAIDAAAPGSIIVVKHGTYAENLVIKTDGIKLAGRGVTLTPPTTPAPDPCSPAPAVDGICVTGQLDFPPNGPPTVTQPVENVKISGFTISGFSSTGIIFFGATNPVVTRNQTDDDGGYGIARFVSSGGAIVGNEASGNAEAGIYVGDSPNADVLVAGNRSHDNQLFGFFFRDSANARAIGNEASGNCVGMIVLNTGGNVAGNWRLLGNRVHDNDRFCPPDPDEGSPPLSGIGIAIANAHGNVVSGNVIKSNVPSQQVPFAGGVAILDAGSPGAEAPSNNVVKGNVILGNEPDLFWDGTGTGNVLQPNVCRTSTPDGLCGGPHGHPHGHDSRNHRHHHHDHHHD
jgi:parallel beta-helix repeat protein